MDSAEEQLKARFEKMRSEGLINFSITPGDLWSELNREERCQALLDMLDASSDRTRGDEPPLCRSPPTDVRRLVEEL
jgi:hypothetical protein